jgi:hypothetical protein
MRIIREGAHILFSTLTPSYLEETVALACTVFSQREPMAKALELGPAELRPYVEAHATASCNEELGVIALERKSGRVVGFSLAKDYLTPVQWRVTERLAPMRQVLETLDHWYLGDYGSPRAPGVLGRELMTGVASEHPYLQTRRATIAPTLGYELMALRTGLLSARGFQQSIALATDPRSQQIHGGLGAYRLCSVSYGDFTCMGDRQRPFAALRGGSCALLLKDLQEAKAGLAGRTLRGAVSWPSSSSWREPSSPNLVAETPGVAA